MFEKRFNSDILKFENCGNYMQKYNLQLVQNFGPDVYFNLDVAKERLIQDVQNSAKDIAAAIEHYSKLTISDNTNITRAIVAYLPPNMQNFEKEFKALYLSIAVMRLYQTSNIKIDVLIFFSQRGPTFTSLTWLRT
jgi:hypothetical protein